MKFWLLTVFCFVFWQSATSQALSQSPPAAASDTSYKLPCDCSALKDGPRGFLPSEKEAQKVVADLLKLMKQNSSLTYTDSIAIKAAGCGPPEARNCPTRLPDERLTDVPLILYNNVFLRGITRKDGPITRIDLHILSHEIGHHVLGHLKNTNGEAVFSELHGTDAVSTNRIARRYKLSNANQASQNRHAQEIQADFFALWLLSLKEKSLDFESFAAEFDTDYIKKYIDKDATYSATHPFFGDRIKAMRRFWPQLQIRKLQDQGISRGYLASAASAAYVDIHPEQKFLDFAFVGGATVAGKPEFSVNNKPVDAMLYNLSNTFNAYAGISASYFRWDSPWRYEAEIAYSTEQYSTILGSGTSRQLLETFNLRYATIFPKFTWSPGIKPNGKFSTKRIGFFMGAGPIFRVPLKLGYVNHAIQIAPSAVPQLQFSVNPRVTLGLELIKKSFLPRAYKIALNYELQNIQLKTDSNPKTLSHNLDVTLYYTFLRL